MKKWTKPLAILVAVVVLVAAGVAVKNANEAAHRNYTQAKKLDNAQTAKLKRELEKPSVTGDYMFDYNDWRGLKQVDYLTKKIGKNGDPGPEVPRYGVDGDPTLHTGSFLRMDDDNLTEKDFEFCTLGPTLTDGTQKILTTAGHCFNSQPYAYYYESKFGKPIPLGNSAWGDNHQTTEKLGFRTDAGVIGVTNKNVDVTTNIITKTGREYAPARFATAEDLKPGVEVCKNGASTGETCGPLLVSRENSIMANVPNFGGDSGSAGYIRTGKYNADGVEEVLVIGWLSGSPFTSEHIANHYLSVFYLAEPVAKRLHLDLAT